MEKIKFRLVKKFTKDEYRIYIVENEIFGHLNGYVGVPKGNSFYGIHYTSLSEVGIYLKCHWGLTFSGKVEYSEDDSKFWYFGFDCAHAGDLVKNSPFNLEWDIYRDEEYVEESCLELVRDLKRYTKKYDLFKAFLKLGFLNANILEE